MNAKQLTKLAAFPRSYAGDPKSDGMTLYQYYVGQALMGLCASQQVYKPEDMGKVAASCAESAINAIAEKV